MHCAYIVGTFSIRFEPSFLGIGIERSPWCFQLLAWVFNFCSNSNLSLKSKANFPSIPAVFLPLFSCVTWRIARNLAATERIISFCNDRALAVSPSLTALYVRFCKRNKSLRNYFQGRFTQDSLSSFSMCPIMFCSSFTYSEFLLAITPHPTRRLVFRYSSSLSGFRLHPEPDIDVFIRSVCEIDWHFRAVQFAYIPSRRSSYLGDNTARIIGSEVHIVLFRLWLKNKTFF